MKNHNINTILKGKSGEHYFIYEVMKRGYNIAQSLQEDSAYDFILDNGRKCIKIQFKACFNPKIDIIKKGKYVSKLKRHFFRLKRNSNKNYSKKEVDFIVCFLDETKDFYILPISVASKIKSLTINLENKTKTKYYRYINAWNMLLE